MIKRISVRVRTPAIRGWKPFVLAALILQFGDRVGDLFGILDLFRCGANENGCYEAVC